MNINNDIFCNKLRTCNTCGESKTLCDNFFKHNNGREGYINCCKVCYTKKYRSRTYTGIRGGNKEGARLRADSDADQAYQVLENIGYELDNPDNSVYEQFKKRVKEKYGVDL